MAKITPSLSTRVDARGKSEILLRFVGGRDHSYRLHSRLFVVPSRWKNGAVVIPRLETEEQKELVALQDRLDALVRFLLDRFQEGDHARINRRWMQDSVDLFFHPERDNNEDLLSMYDEYSRTREVGQLRRKRYAVVGGSLERFQKYLGRRLSVADFTPAILEDYHKFLTDEHKICRMKRWAHIYKGMNPLPEERGKNSIIDYMKGLRAFFNWLAGRGFQVNDPFKGFHIGTAVYGTPYYITIEERDRIARTNLNRHPSLAVQRDVFVFQCLVGCRVGDLVKLRKEDIVDGVLTYIPRKTIDERPVVVRVPLNQTAMEIVERYADIGGAQLLPFISKQKYNDAIKRIFLAARIRRPVATLDPLTRKEVKRPLHEVASSHLARRTFIGNLYKQVADPNLIGAMSGHTEGSKAFARYRDIDDEMKAGLVGKLEVK